MAERLIEASATGRPRPAELALGVARVVASPLNAALLGAGALVSAGAHAWQFVAVAGAFVTVRVARRLTSPGFRLWMRAALPEPRRLHDRRLRAAAKSIVGARRTLEASIAGASPGVAAEAAGIRGPVDELTARAARLLASGDAIARHLARGDPRAVRRELDRARARARSGDAHWRGAAAAREEQLRVLDDLAGALERIEANLVRIVAVLEGLSGRIVRMRAVDAEATGDLLGDVSSELARLDGEVRTFERTLGQLAGARAHVTA